MHTADQFLAVSMHTADTVSSNQYAHNGYSLIVLPFLSLHATYHPGGQSRQGALSS